MFVETSDLMGVGVIFLGSSAVEDIIEAESLVDVFLTTALSRLLGEG